MTVKVSHSKGNSRLQKKYFVPIVFTQVVISLWKSPGWAAANFSLFNALARFALFWCTSFRAARAKKMCERSKNK